MLTTLEAVAEHPDKNLPADTPILKAIKEASAQDLIGLLVRFGLLESFLRQLKEREIVFNSKNLSDPESIRDSAMGSYLEANGITQPEALRNWCIEHALTEQDLLSESIHNWRRKELRENLITASGETLYLRYKDRLDRILYRLLRVRDEGFCRELFFAIDAGEITFAEAASLYSEGPESRTQGFVGPVDLTTPHPEIAARLKTAQVGQLIGPFKADDWYTIIKLQYRFESEYDDSTKEFLREVCFKSLITSGIDNEMKALLLWLSNHSNP